MIPIQSIEHDGHSSHWEDSTVQRRPVNNYERAILLYRVEPVFPSVVVVQVPAVNEVI